MRPPFSISSILWLKTPRDARFDDLFSKVMGGACDRMDSLTSDGYLNRIVRDKASAEEEKKQVQELENFQKF